MAVNESRSMNAELKLGAVEATYRLAHPNRGGVVEDNDRGLSPAFGLQDVVRPIFDQPLRNKLQVIGLSGHDTL